MLEINPELLLLTAVVFLVLIYVLNVILFKPVLNFIDMRNQSIANEEKELAKYGNDIKKYEEEANKILATAREEVIAIKAAAANKANETARERIEARKIELEKEYKEFEADLKAEHETLKKDLQAKLPEIRASLKSTLSKL